MIFSERYLHKKLLAIDALIQGDGGERPSQVRIDQCTRLLMAMHEIYPDALLAVRAIQDSAQGGKEGLRRSLAYVIGISHCPDTRSSLRYYTDITQLARNEPHFLSEVLLHAHKVQGDRRLEKPLQTEMVTLETAVQVFDSVLGSLLIQPVRTLRGFPCIGQPLMIDLFSAYVSLARVVDPRGLQAVRSFCEEKFKIMPVDFHGDPGRGIALRRVLFEGQIITTMECSYRIRNAAPALFGNAGWSYSPEQLAIDLEAFSYSTEFMKHAFVADFYLAQQSEESELGLQDPCEESFVPLAVNVQARYCKILKDFLIQQGFDVGLTMAPWILGYSTFSSALTTKHSYGDDLRWLDREAIRTAGAWFESAINNSKPGRVQSRRYAWIKGLTKQDCILLCENDHELMACFKATGYSRLIRGIQSDAYREEILACDMGL